MMQFRGGPTGVWYEQRIRKTRAQSKSEESVKPKKKSKKGKGVLERQRHQQNPEVGRICSKSAVAPAPFGEKEVQNCCSLWKQQIQRDSTSNICFLLSGTFCQLGKISSGKFCHCKFSRKEKILQGKALVEYTYMHPYNYILHLNL